MDVLANGVRFHVQELGRGSPVVMLHGLLLGSIASWYFTAAPALARTHRVRLFDLRGHGRTERTATGYDTATMVDDLAALAAPLGPGPVSLVGHSYGALVSLRFALAHPERVARLALVEAPLPPSRVGELAATGPRELVEGLPEPLRAAVARGGRQVTRLLESLDFLLRESSLRADVAAEQDIADDVLATVRCPVLCAYGSRSSCLPAGERIARAIPGAKLAVLEGGHFLHLDAPGPLTRLLEEHLDG